VIPPPGVAGPEVENAPISVAQISLAQISLAPVSVAPVSVGPVSVGPVSAALVSFADLAESGFAPLVSVARASVAPVSAAQISVGPVSVGPVSAALVSFADLAESGFAALVSVARASVAPVSAAQISVGPVSAVLVSFADLAESGFAALVSAADLADPQISGDIALAFDALVPLSVVAVGVDSPERPRFFAFPNIDYYASSPSPVEVVGAESGHSPTGVRTNYGLGRILSNLGLHHNKSLEHCYNKPNPGHNIVSNTNDLPRDATTNHSRKICLHLYQEQSTHRPYQASLPHPEVHKI